jgi:hypothetical protein
MKKIKRRKKYYPGYKLLLPIHIIKGATQYDIESVEAVLEHFKGYIITLATIELYDKEGQVYYFLDENLQHRLEAKLLETLSDFNMAKYL